MFWHTLLAISILLFEWTARAFKSFPYIAKQQIISKSMRIMDSSASFMFTGNDNVEDDKPLFKEPVIYFDPASPIVTATLPTRSLPLFLLEMPFYPQGITFLNIFEMKYRTMMFDIAKIDDMFGYIHCDYTTGRLASVGTLCKVVERNLLEDGRQQIALAGIGRFRVNRVITTLPYMQAEVETNIVDGTVTNEGEADKLEKDVYNYLKYYLRLFKFYSPDRDVRVTPGVHKYRPRNTNVQDPENAIRRSNFTFSISNIIQMVNPTEAQLLLQTTNVVKRLKAQKDIFQAATEYISDTLIESGKISVDLRNEIRIRAFVEVDDDDLQPHGDINDDENSQEEVDEWDISNVN